MLFNVKCLMSYIRVEVGKRESEAARVVPAAAGRRRGRWGIRGPSIGKNSIRAVRHYVSNGGRYLGICMGAYLAGDPGFGLVAGEFDSEVGRPDSTLHGIADTVTPVVWRGKKRWIYFQDGAMLPAAPGAVVLATYPNRDIAAATYRYGKGRVGLVGPHPEADESWYRQNGLKNPDGIRPDMAHDLINATMKP
uniref:BPL-N domain-containing protein n=1 Tax=Burkholderia sp. AU33423 TaxID=2015355 RepID=UPI0027960BF0|nr:BPL-N domain-containing protein [Burkholderia sp. AU33423]